MYPACDLALLFLYVFLCLSLPTLRSLILYLLNHV